MQEYVGKRAVVSVLRSSWSCAKRQAESGGQLLESFPLMVPMRMGRRRVVSVVRSLVRSLGPGRAPAPAGCPGPTPHY